MLFKIIKYFSSAITTDQKAENIFSALKTEFCIRTRIPTSKEKLFTVNCDLPAFFCSKMDYA